MSCPNLALVHTSIEHSRDWCRRLLILGCQEPYAHQALHPVRWCGRLLKTTRSLEFVRLKSMTLASMCQRM
ncbi:resolvase [Pseudomonas aeruginosa]|nr:resolvase [Pseudomonas aeruginosa]MCO1686242.1 resolvase [Pseudomonas aeruginosa]MCO1780406.1 resolvase [Pseudomonas aeruginosa]MCO1790329.1 resolvase [Pseudomonas aeruginosa]MCO1799067.1 resolvase [Pseudomonas aeruginosa]